MCGAQAFVSGDVAVEEAKYRVDKMAGTATPFIAALSYRWLERGHPDQCRHHLPIVTKVLRLYMKQLDDELREKRASLKEFGLFWDFASLPQVSTIFCS